MRNLERHVAYLEDRVRVLERALEEVSRAYGNELAVYSQELHKLHAVAAELQTRVDRLEMPDATIVDVSSF